MSNQLLASAVAALQDALSRSSKLGGDNFKAVRKEVVQLRRLIVARIADVTAAAQALEDGALRQEAVRHVARMRAAIAYHHAAWPVVAIDMEDPAYRESIKRMRDEYAAFFVAMRAHLDRAPAWPAPQRLAGVSPRSSSIGPMSGSLP